VQNADTNGRARAAHRAPPGGDLFFRGAGTAHGHIYRGSNAGAGARVRR
jgi:hypothetical protein